MNPATNETFDRLLQLIGGMGDEARLRASDTDGYKAFIAQFPVGRLRDLGADQYCVGKGENDTFCRWIERGLESALGRYMPGTSRGHIVYFRKESGSFYKNRLLHGLSDEEALKYTLKIQTVIAGADTTKDLNWIDDDAEIYFQAS